MLRFIFAAALVATATASDQLSTGALPSTILVAAATANTGGSLVRLLSAEGKVDIIAAVRSLDDARSTALAALPRVTAVVVDFDDVATVAAALEGVDRAFLVSAPFDNLQFERETDFLELAGKAGIPTVRVGTYTGLYGAGSKTSYARAHHGIEFFAELNGIPTVTLRPNWFFDNLLFGAAEIKAAGQITYPSAGDGIKGAFIDPRDVASAAAKILMLPGDLLSTFVAAQAIEVHGPSTLNLAENVALLSKAVGYPIKINVAPIAGWVDAMVGYGMPRVHARSFGATVMKVAGDLAMDGPTTNTNSPLLTGIGWKPQYDVNDWVNSAKVQGAFKKDKEEL